MNLTACVNLVEVSSGPESWRFGLHPEHVRLGWDWRLEAIRRAAEMGCRRHILHLPLGREVKDGTFQFDTVSSLLAAGTEYRALVHGFAPFVQRASREGHRIEVYLGCLQGSVGMMALRRPLRQDDYLRRLATNLKPYLEAGCHRLYFDASVFIRGHDPEYGVLRWLIGMGIDVGIEPWPVQAGHWAGLPVFTVEHEYHAHRRLPGALPKEKAGEVVRSLNHEPPMNRESAVEAILADGHTPAIDVLAA